MASGYYVYTGGGLVVLVCIYLYLIWEPSEDMCSGVCSSGDVWSTVVSTPLCLLVDSGVCTRDHGVVCCGAHDVLWIWTWYSTESPGEDVDLCMLLGVWCVGYTS